MEKKDANIELSPLEIKMLELFIANELNLETLNIEERKAFSRVINMADELMYELNAYDELKGNFMEWFYNKYLEQQTKL